MTGPINHERTERFVRAFSSSLCLSFPKLRKMSMKWMLRLIAVVLALGIAAGQAKKTDKTDAQIKQEIIKLSIANYRGSCPCPYNVDRAGRMCGARSAYSKPGGASPICYEKDVTQKMVEEYRKAK